jgi:N-methylhydantoinase A
VNGALAELDAAADAFLADLADAAPIETRKELAVDARYRAQVWELGVPIPGLLEGDEDVQALEEAFHATHERVFAVREPGQYLECLLWKVRATAVLAKPDVRSRELPPPGEPELVDLAEAYFPDRGRTPVPRFDGASLPAGARIEGPAVIREPTTTVVVYPGSAAMVTALGNYLLEVGDELRAPELAGEEAAAR